MLEPKSSIPVNSASTLAGLDPGSMLCVNACISGCGRAVGSADPVPSSESCESIGESPLPLKNCPFEKWTANVGMAGTTQRSSPSVSTITGEPRCDYKIKKLNPRRYPGALALRMVGFE